MYALARSVSPPSPFAGLAAATALAGAAGMAVSFLFLAASDPRDVTAGAAGFVAGSVLIAGGLVSLALCRPAAREEASPAEPAVDADRWLAHFRKNRLNRPEPDWSAPVALPAAVVRPLVRSLEQFQLGDGGGPAYLIARDRESFLGTGDRTRALVDAWFVEEREHSRLLGALVARLGGRPIEGHWSFTAFCLVRTRLGVRFELTVLLLTELASTVYYRLLRKHVPDPAVRATCKLILRDEAGHVAFHRDRLARAGRRYGTLWGATFRALGLAAATVLWASHARGLRAAGATRAEFYGEVWAELTRFTRRLRRDAAGARPAGF